MDKNADSLVQSNGTIELGKVEFNESSTKGFDEFRKKIPTESDVSDKEY